MTHFKLEITRPYSYQVELRVLKKVFGLWWSTETCWCVERFGEEGRLIEETVLMIEKFKSMYGLEEPDIIGSPYAKKIS